MKQLEQTKIRRAIDSLLRVDATLPILGEESRSDLGKVMKLDKDYLNICTAFTFNVYNLGLEQAAIFCEQKPQGKALEKKRAIFCKAVLHFLGVQEQMLLTVYIHQSKDQNKLRFDISEALDYLKLGMLLGIVPNSNSSS